MKKTKRIIAIMVAVMMLTTFMPTSVFAAGIGTAKDLSLDVGRENASTPVGSNVYYGGELYRVVAKDANNMTLFLDGGLGARVYCDHNNNSAWNGSTICGYLNGAGGVSDPFIQTFTSAEVAAMVAKYKTDEESYPNNPSYTFGGKMNVDQTIVLPSYDEVRNGGTWGMTANDRKFSDDWWLRTPFMENYAIYVSKNSGNLDLATNIKQLINGSSPLSDTRPAFKLDFSSILFTSDAKDGKDVSPGSALNKVTSPGEPVKLTVIDKDNLSLKVANQKPITTTAGSTISVDYTDAKTGSGHYVSALLSDSSNKTIYYGQLLDCGSSNEKGKASIKLPVGLADGKYSIKLFNENVNADYETDYASVPVTLSLNIITQKTINSIAKVNFVVNKKTIEKRSVTLNAKIGNLPKAKMKNKSFKGWYTKTKGGTKITKNYAIKKDQNIYAQWYKVAKVKKSKTKIYKKASTKSKVVKKIKKSKKVIILSSKGKFYKVKYGKKTGYIAKKSVKVLK